jgi:PAS domain S-box-containing protein
MVTSGVKASGHRPTVLAVDDNDANLLALEAVLERDCNVVSARSGSEAIALLEAKLCDIDVVLLDVHMPDLDGFETAERIKKMEGCEDIPIVFVTAVYKEDPHIRRGYEAGGIDYFGKPFDPDILRLKIAIYASFRQRAKHLQERERNARDSEELLTVGKKLASVLESLPVGVLIADTAGRICQATEEVARILRTGARTDGVSYGEMLAWWGGDGHSLKDLGGALARAIGEGESSHSKTVQIRCLDGSTSSVLASTAPLRGVGGEIVGAVILIQDLTEPRRIGEAFEKRVARFIGLGVELEQTTAPRQPGL